jgi:hypothetical protein
VALEGLQPASASTAAQPARITPPAPASSRPPPPPSTAPTLGGRYQILARGAEVKDLSTGLVWQRCSVGQSWDGQTCAGQAQRFSFGEAQALGRNGWRVPGKEELDSLVDQQAGRPTIHAQAFPATSAYWYWSSTPYAGRASDARVVYFGNSLIYRDHRSGTYPVRLVR